MARKAASRKKPEPSALGEAAVRTLTGLAFGLLVAVVVVTASVFEWRPVKLLQTWGSDIGLRIFADPIFAPDKDYLVTDTPFVFLDIDEDACAAFVGPARAASDCSDPSTPPADLITALLEGLDDAGATAVILDYRLPNPGKVADAAARTRLERLKAVLTAEEGVPVIAPAPLDPAARVASVVDRESDRLVEGWSAGRLRLAAFMTWADPEARDGIVRGYPAVLDVQRIAEETTLAYLPSAPFLAALIAEQEDGLAAADALFYAPPDRPSCDALKTGAGTVIGRSAPFLAEHCVGRSRIPMDSLLLKPQIFSIYSLSLPAAYQDGRSFDDQRLRDLAVAYYGAGTVEGGMLYRRYRAKDFIGEDGTFERLFDEPDNLGKQIVVIGTSAFDAGDWHRTSVGALAGAEVIVNAARAFSDFSPLATKKSFAAKLWQKVQLTCIAAVVLFFFTWVSVAIARGRWITAPSSLTRRWHYPLAPLAGLMGPVVFLAGVGVAMIFVSIRTWQIAASGALASVDFLLPVLAVAFEGLVEMSHAFLGHVHHWVEHRIADIRKWVGKIRG